MSKWSLEFEPKAEKDLAQLDKAVRARVLEKLDWLLENFDSLFPIPLHNEWRDFYKLRVGDYRIAYQINWKNNSIKVCYIDNRNKIYKRK
ncbi:MAG: type II toxin-antitoxin system RelE/ParE family toxin [Patescibacteria group bacterium]